MTTGIPTPEQPIYSKVAHRDSATPFYYVVCDEGWRSSIVCQEMYEWAADWLIEILQGRPFAPESRP